MPTKACKIDNASLVAIADAVPALIALYNIKTGEYIYVNNSIKKLLGYTPEDFIVGGMEFVASLIHPDDIAGIMAKNQAALAAANSNPKVGQDESIANFEYRMRHNNGEWRWLHTEGTVFKRSDDGKVELLLNVSLDITARKAAETHLKTSLKALEEILAVS